MDNQQPNELKNQLLELKSRLGRTPVKRDCPNLQRKIKEVYGSWSNALIQVFGDCNVYRSGFHKDELALQLEQLSKELGRVPKSKDDAKLTARVQRSFGSWNKGLKYTFGEINQARYKGAPEQWIRDFVSKHQRLPLRQEFDGEDWPYWEYLTNQMGVTKWSQVLERVDLSDLSYRFSTSHGFGTLRKVHGYVCFSNEEASIVRYLVINNIDFEKEVPYGNSEHFFDFYLPEFDVYVEYYGIATEDYLNRVEIKRQYYDERKVVEIFKHDNTIGRLDSEVQRLQSLTPRGKV